MRNTTIFVHIGLLEILLKQQQLYYKVKGETYREKTSSDLSIRTIQFEEFWELKFTYLEGF